MQNNKFFTAVYQGLRSANLLGDTGTAHSDHNLAYRASDVVWDVYCNNTLADSEVPMLERVEPGFEDDANSYLYIFDDGIYVKVEAYAGVVYLDTSGPVYP